MERVRATTGHAILPGARAALVFARRIERFCRTSPRGLCAQQLPSRRQVAPDASISARRWLDWLQGWARQLHLARPNDSCKRSRRGRFAHFASLSRCAGKARVFDRNLRARQRFGQSRAAVVRLSLRLFRLLQFVFKDDGKTPYCEVHHITPFCEGGEDALENLSVLCAHHHRMAHFAVEKERAELREFLLARTAKILANTPFSWPPLP